MYIHLMGEKRSLLYDSITDVEKADRAVMRSDQ
jgi:hypothetical protein